MSDERVESTVTASVNAGRAESVGDKKVESEKTKGSSANGLAIETASSNKKKLVSTDNAGSSDLEKVSKKKVTKEKPNVDESKSPVKRKAKEKSSDDEASEKETSPVKKKAKKDAKDSEVVTNSNSENSVKNEQKVKDDEDDDDEDDEEVQPGLLERPAILEEGIKREKKKVQRLDLTPSADKTDGVKRVEIAEGSGTKLGDLPRVERQLQKLHADELKPLHRLLFERIGTHIEVKRNIRRFTGFPFSRSSPEFEKKKEKLNKYTSPMLKTICEVLDIERGGRKDEIIDRILNFTLKPQSSGKPVPSAKRKRSSIEKSKTPDSKKSKKVKSSPKQKVSKSKKNESGVEGSNEDDHDVVDEKMSEVEESETELDADCDSEKKKKVTKNVTPAKKIKTSESKTPKSAGKSSAKKPAKKAPQSPKKKQATPKKAKAVASDDSEDDDKPLVKKNLPPTDDVLKTFIKKILKTANLEEVTMKTVCKQVYDKYPEHDLTARKEFIKTTVKQILK